MLNNILQAQQNTFQFLIFLLCLLYLTSGYNLFVINKRIIVLISNGVVIFVGTISFKVILLIISYSCITFCDHIWVSSNWNNLFTFTMYFKVNTWLKNLWNYRLTAIHYKQDRRNNNLKILYIYFHIQSIYQNLFIKIYWLKFD